MHNEPLSRLQPSHEDLRPMTVAEFRAQLALVGMTVIAYATLMLAVTR